MQNGDTTLILASGNGHLDVVNRLLDCKEIDVNVQTTVLWEMFDFAISPSFFPNSRPLLFCMWFFNEKFCLTANKNKSFFVWTALMEASRYGHLDVINRLLDCKETDVNVQHTTIELRERFTFQTNVCGKCLISPHPVFPQILALFFFGCGF